MSEPTPKDYAMCLGIIKELQARLDVEKQQNKSWQNVFGQVVEAKSEIVEQRNKAYRIAVEMFDEWRSGCGAWQGWSSTISRLRDV